jgi:hypothetical protein
MSSPKACSRTVIRHARFFVDTHMDGTGQSWGASFGVRSCVETRSGLPLRAGRTWTTKRPCRHVMRIVFCPFLFFFRARIALDTLYCFLADREVFFTSFVQFFCLPLAAKGILGPTRIGGVQRNEANSGVFVLFVLGERNITIFNVQYIHNSKFQCCEAHCSAVRRC